MLPRNQYISSGYGPEHTKGDAGGGRYAPLYYRLKQKTGMLRLSLWLQQRKQADNDAAVDLPNNEKKMQKWYMMCGWLNKTMMNVVKNTPYNMEKTSDLKFPGRIPVLFCLQSGTRDSGSSQGLGRESKIKKRGGGVR